MTMNPTTNAVCHTPAAIANAYKRVGQHYGLFELLEDGGRDLLHIPFHYQWNSPHLTCSGLVVEVYREAGVIITRAPLPSPGDVGYSPILTLIGGADNGSRNG